MEILAYLYGIIIGLALGLTGGGGSIFAVPLLIYGLHIAPHAAIGVSLAAVALTSAFGVAGAVRTRLVDFRAGLIFAAGGVLAAPFGVKLAHRFPEPAILTGFAVLMVAVAVSMWLRARRTPQSSAVVRADFVPAVLDDAGPICRLNDDRKLHLTGPCSAVLSGVGVLAGVLSGLFGVGGGFIIVPALRFVTQLDIHRAVATSLLVIMLVGFSGVAAMLVEGRNLPWIITGLFVAGGFTGMFAGRLIAHRIAGPRLEKLFAVAMLGVAGFIIYIRTMH